MNERAAGWNSIETHGKILFQRIPMIEATSRAIRDVLTAQFPGRDRILDLGTGMGILPAAVPPQMAERIIGLDINRDPLKISRSSGISSDLVQADILRLPFADNQFRYVTGLTFLSSMVKPEQAVKEIHRVLKPDGIFIHFLDILPDFAQQMRLFQKKGKIPFVYINDKGKLSFTLADRKNFEQRFDKDRLRRFCQENLGQDHEKTSAGVINMLNKYLANPYAAVISIIRAGGDSHKNEVGGADFANNILTVLKFLGIKREEYGAIDEVFAQQMIGYMKAAGFETAEMGFVEKDIMLPKKDFMDYPSVWESRNNVYINMTGRFLPMYDSLLDKTQPGMIRVISQVQVITAGKREIGK